MVRIIQITPVIEAVRKGCKRIEKKKYEETINNSKEVPDKFWNH